MGRIVTLAERALAKAGAVVEKIVPDDPDKAVMLGNKIEKIVGKKAFKRIEQVVEAADEQLDGRRIDKERDPYIRAMMLGKPVNEARQFILDDRSRDRGRGL